MNFSRPSAITSLIALTLSLIAAPALAQDSSLGDMICSAYVNTKSFGKLFEYAAYIIGVFCVLQGVYYFRAHSEHGAKEPLNKPIILWIGAACLLVLPDFIGAVIETLYGNASSGGAGSPATCSAGAVSPGTGQMLDVLMTNLVTNIKKPILMLVSFVSIVTGLFFIVRGLTKGSKYGIDSRTHSIQSIMANIVFGALLMTIGDNLNMMMDTVFGSTSITSSSSVLNWKFTSGVGTSASFQNAVQAALTFVQLIGVIAFVRGWLILKKAVEGGGDKMAQGITHIVGGVLAINIFGFLKIMDNTFGTGLL